VVIVIETNAATQILFKGHISNEWVARQIGPDLKVIKVRNNPFHRIAQNCKKFARLIENRLNVISQVIASQATNLTPPHTRQLREFLDNACRRIHPKTCIRGVVTMKVDINELISEATLQDCRHRHSAGFGNMKENQDRGRRKPRNTVARGP
jgi:hypothetical protein